MQATGEQSEGDISAVVGEATVFHNPTEYANGVLPRYSIFVAFVALTHP